MVSLEKWAFNMRDRNVPDRIETYSSDEGETFMFQIFENNNVIAESRAEFKSKNEAILNAEN